MSESFQESAAEYPVPADPPDRPYITKSGKLLTEADIEALVAEAERGYDVSHLRPTEEAN